MNIDSAKRFILGAREQFEQNLELLSRYDSVLGDGDHGVSMLKGFRSIADTVGGKEYASIGDMLFEAGRLLMREMGGTCGPLFGTLFMKAGMLSKGRAELGTAELAAMFRAASDGVMALGKAKPGEKTMVDALEPAALALERAAAEGLGEREALALASSASEEGLAATEHMLATKGRGRYQGEASLGARDAGAASVSLIFRALAASAE